MRCFGGRGTRAQACEERKCLGMDGGSGKDMKQGKDWDPKKPIQELPKIPVVNWTKFILCTIK